MKLKSSIIILVIFAIAFSLFMVVPCGTAYAQQDSGYTVRGDYNVEIAFGYFNLSSGRVLQTFSLTFEKEYFAQIDNKDKLLTMLSTYLKLLQFTPEIDNAGRVIGRQEYESMTDLYIRNKRDGYRKHPASDDKENTTFFFREIYSEQETFFAGIHGDNDALDYLLFQLYMFGITDDDIALGYHYGTPYKVIDTNAERKYFDINQRIYIHEFQMDVSTANREILLVQKVPNAVNWYLFAIFITIPFVIVPIAIGIYLKIKDKKRSEY